MLGLFAMHGLQAESSPADTHPAATVVAMSGMSHTDAKTGHPTTPSHHPPGHEHPGGQMCLAMLVMAVLLVLSAVFVGRREGSVAPSGPAGRGHDQQGRAPPPLSVFQLSVLRL
ncbi:MAG: DUF6153 family protein [Actinoallomurus sp.]